MTHDLRSAFDLAKVRSELKGGKGNSSDRKFLKLVNKQLKPRQGNNDDEKLLESVYDYAKNPIDDEDEYVETSIAFHKARKGTDSKEPLVFLNYINKEHLSCYLGKNKEGDEDRMAEIEKWK